MDAGDRFPFGANWRRFLETVDERAVQAACRSLSDMLGDRQLGNATLLDAGSGSGLFSLAAARAGARVRSFDYDVEAVACTREMKRRFDADNQQWRIDEGSVLDADWLAGLGVFDVVYSWGVLHHTGDMWRAIELVTGTVAEGGHLWIALYNDQGWVSCYWLAVKRAYNRGTVSRALVIAWHMPYLIGVRWLARRLRGAGPLERGMSLWYDMHDWLGGYPFEVARPEQVETFLRERGFVPVKSKLCGRRPGCNEYLFVRQAQAASA